jgi:hypothetical protein
MSEQHSEIAATSLLFQEEQQQDSLQTLIAALRPVFAQLEDDDFESEVCNGTNAAQFGKENAGQESKEGWQQQQEDEQQQPQEASSASSSSTTTNAYGTQSNSIGGSCCFLASTSAPAPAAASRPGEVSSHGYNRYNEQWCSSS